MIKSVPFRLFVFVFGVMLTACMTSEKAAPFSYFGEAALISDIMQQQEDSWNRGDIDGFMEHYWNSDSLVFIGSRGLTHGWQQTLDNYKKSYPTKDRMGRLAFRNVEIDVFDPKHAWVLGNWTLFRTTDTLSGYYTLKWRKIKGKWVIVADHSS